MDPLFSLLKVPTKKKINARISTPAHSLVEELLEWFGESKKKGMCGRYMGVIKRRGEPQVRMIFSELKEQKEHSPKLFMWKCSKKADVSSIENS